MASTDKKVKSKPSLSNSLTKYVQDYAVPTRQERSQVHAALVRRIVAPILEKIGELDDRFRNECTGLRQPSAGSCYVGVSRSEHYRVDMVVVLPNLVSSKCVSDKSEDPPITTPPSAAFLDSVSCDNPYVSSLPGFGYLLVDPTKCLVHDLLSIKQDDVSSAQQEDVSFANKSFVSPGKVVKAFFNLVEESVEILLQECVWEEEPTIYEITAKREGHSVRIHVILKGQEYTIDLIPALELSGWWPKSLRDWGPKEAARPNHWLDYPRMAKVKQSFHVYAARPPPGHDAFRLWCTYFGLSEKVLVESVIDDHKLGRSLMPSCRAEVLLGMLALCEENAEEFHPVTPRIITTAFLHQCTQYPLDDDWAPHKLGRAFVDLFMALIGMVRAGTCNHYFLPEVNILDNSDDLKPVVHHLKVILGDIVENPNKTHFLHANRRSKDENSPDGGLHFSLNNNKKKKEKSK